jgi:predicted membrane protein (TIGR00267 family)
METILMDKVHTEQHHAQDTGYNLRDIILGGQDGLVNVLGVILAVATAVSDTRLVIIAGLAATFAESISMAAVAYTSTKAARDFYKSEEKRELWEIDNMRDDEIREIRDIYEKKGFKGETLEEIVKHITSDKDLWLKVMMEEELRLYPEEYKNPVKDAVIVGVSALVGSLVPLLPFIFLPLADAIIGSVIISVIVLFLTGWVKGRLTTGKNLRAGIEMAVIGMAAALAGYAIGAVLGVALYAA